MKKINTACPNCSKISDLTMRNPFCPFCSERCKLIDLGQWASENYRIPVENAPKPDTLDEF